MQDTPDSQAGKNAAGHGYYFEDLSEGMEESYSKRITAEDVEHFAELSGDVNPVHLDDAFAAGTLFKKRIAHGFLTGSLISTVLGTKLPGPGCIYLSQDLKFVAPVYLGDEVTATVSILGLDAKKRRAILNCICSVDGKAVLTGVAEVMVESRERKREGSRADV